MTAVPRLLLITDRTQTRGRPLEEIVAACASAGITHLLLRERDLSPAAYDELLARIRGCVDGATTILTRSARPDGAGCHLAQHTPWPVEATGLVGRSVHNPAQVHRARSEGADFVIAGPFATTASKPGYGPGLGAGGIRELASHAANLPLLAVGGIRPSGFKQLAATGAYGAAVMGPLMRAPDPHSLALEYVSAAGEFDDETTFNKQ